MGKICTETPYFSVISNFVNLQFWAVGDPPTPQYNRLFSGGTDFSANPEKPYIPLCVIRKYGGLDLTVLSAHDRVLHIADDPEKIGTCIGVAVCHSPAVDLRYRMHPD